MNMMVAIANKHALALRLATCEKLLLMISQLISQDSSEDDTRLHVYTSHKRMISHRIRLFPMLM